MKKGISLLLVLMLVFGLFTAVAFAEAPADKGFYNISMETGTTITPFNIAGGTVTEEEGLFKGSDAFTVEYINAVSGKEYMVWLVQGTAIDLANNNVYYVNQQTAPSTTVSFDVKPTTWQTDGKKMAEGVEYTVFISTDATGEGAFKVGSVYYGGAAPAGKKGDANGDGKVNAKDRAILNRYLAGWDGYAPQIVDMDEFGYSYNMDVNGDGKVNAKDRAILNRYLAGWGGDYDDYFKTE